MSFEATKNLSGARQMVKIITMELDTLDGYSSPAFDSIGGGRSGIHSDRVAKMAIKRDQVKKHLVSTLEDCIELETASKAELATVENLEVRAMIQYREINGMTWAQIGKEMNLTADAAKKRYERGMKAYQEQEIRVNYSDRSLLAMRRLRRAG